MTNKEKPWLSATTAEDALNEAIQKHFGKCKFDEFRKLCAQAVIEWHESRREKVGEWWDAISNIVGDHLSSVREAAHEQGLSAARDYIRQRDEAFARTNYQRGLKDERRDVVAYIKRMSWNDVQDWNGDQFEGDYNDIAKVIRECIEKGEHEVKR